MDRLWELLTRAADEALVAQTDDGALPAGKNGPWEDPQTPVRNTCHWLVTFLECYERYGQERHRDAALAALTRITSTDARPYGYTFSHLPEHDLSRCNGLIGQAWTIEALVRAADHFDRPDLLSVAEEVFTLHPFDSGIPAWHYVDIDGDHSALDKVFNHQLWFAMAGGLLAARGDIGTDVDSQVERFLDSLPETMTLYESGLIYHPLKPEFSLASYTRIFLDGVRTGVVHKMVWNLLRGTFGDDDGDPMRATSVGYHSFNLYAFAVLKTLYPNHSFWEHEKFERALAFARTDSFKARLADNPYGYPYNCSGIEMAYVLEVFENDQRDAQRWWLEQQFKRTLDRKSMTMAHNNPDPATLTARLYEATRLPDIEISLGPKRDAET